MEVQLFIALINKTLQLKMKLYSTVPGFVFDLDVIY